MTHQQHWELAHDTGIVERNGLTYLAALPDGPIVVLDAVASVVLQVALDVSADDVTSEVAAAYGKVPTEVDAAVSEC
ncbi:MAG TPA: hypothetical protein PKI09_13950, partial [Dermatophilaceae bacterium]|nr:hypothetical protein [Dermatophilaceae bacterium]HPZ69891.1 hypothetical protein [Dermatophilaceae bacterium]HQD02714.1 hypothetical protein [Dermatophilaceae bacterium]